MSSTRKVNRKLYWPAHIALAALQRETTAICISFPHELTQWRVETMLTGQTDGLLHQPQEITEQALKVCHAWSRILLTYNGTTKISVSNREHNFPILFWARVSCSPRFGKKQTEIMVQLITNLNVKTRSKVHIRKNLQHKKLCGDSYQKDKAMMTRSAEIMNSNRSISLKPFLP